ncbi:MAG: HAD-IA family hydrolase [Sulfuritalea sp.]|nr:HAD-IA family hydrolase [Sulfuritalea sp.]
MEATAEGAPYEALVFDLDGTLVDTLPDMLAALNGALAEYGQPRMAAAQVQSRLHHGLEGMVDAALERDDGAQRGSGMRGGVLARFETSYALTLVERSRPYPGVASALEKLATRGTRMAVCTNKPQALAERLLAQLGLLEFFGTVVGADTCKERKPSAVPLLHAIKLIGTTPEKTLMIGDSAIDVACANAASVRCWIYTRGYGGIDAVMQGIDSIFDDYAALLGAAGVASAPDGMRATASRR